MDTSASDRDKKRNGIKHVKDHLIEQLERLNDVDLVSEKLAYEIDRAGAMANVSDAICKLSIIELQTAQVNANTLGPIDRLNLPKIDNL